MKISNFFRKQLEPEKWAQAVKKLWLVSQLVTSLLSLNRDAMQYYQQPNIANEINLNCSLLGAYEDVKKTYSCNRKQALD